MTVGVGAYRVIHSALILLWTGMRKKETSMERHTHIKTRNELQGNKQKERKRESSKGKSKRGQKVDLIGGSEEEGGGGRMD